ncbi:MAG: TonB-dependent receptor plug domain-containing protein [Sulfuricurvum sp.]|nr:TonB-dependent receptor plug domain-containing protein [Sulfuricurvum sp.]
MNVIHISKTKKVAMSFLAALAIAPLSAFAAADTVLEPINVTAPIIEHDYLDPKSPTNPYRVETTAEAGTEIFTEKDIQNLAPKDVFDLLDKAVGLDITYQGRKSPFFVNERGGGSFTYIIDGAILPSTSNRILQKIPMSAIEQIEIVRGSTSLPIGPSINIGSSNSGSGLNTGFIIIRTKQPTKTMLTLNAGLEQSEGQPTANKESMYTGLVFGNSDFNGYIGGMIAGMNRPSQDTWFDGQNAQSKMVNAGINAGRFSAKMMIYNDTGRFEMQRGVTLTGTLDPSKWYYDPITTHLFSTDATMQWNEHHTTIASLFKTNYSQTEHDDSFASPTVTAAKLYTEDTSGYSLRHNIHYGDTKVMLGLQRATDSGFGPNTNTAYNKFDTSVLGYSGSLEQTLFDGQLILDGGYRQDTKHIMNSSNTSSTNNANNDVNMAPAKIYTLGAKWFVTPTYDISGRYYHGSQGTMGDFDVKPYPSGTLDPEMQKRVEMSFEAKYSKAFTPMITWFDINIDNYKSQYSYVDASKVTIYPTYVLNGQTYYYYTQSDLHRQGVELLLKGKFDFGTTYKFGWTHMITNEAISSTGVITDNNGNSNAKDLYVATLGHEWDTYRANLSVKRESSWSTSTSAMGTATNVPLGDFTRIDANIMRDLTIGNAKARLSLYGRNLTDEHYATRYTTGYYYDRGRTIGADITMEF